MANLIDVKTADPIFLHLLTQKTKKIELEPFVGLLYLLGIFKSRHEDLMKQEKKVQKDRWPRFQIYSKECYTPGLFLTVDEMLVPFRGRCGFSMYCHDSFIGLSVL